MGTNPKVAIAACFVMAAVALSGCTEGGPNVITDGNEPPQVEATSTTGGIRGVVVDSSIVPIEGATVVILNTQHSAVTDASGAFAISGLEEGTYVVEASHPFFDTVQQSTVVQAGVENPPVLKIQLTRQVYATPYMETIQIAGYIFCSMNIVGAYAEECGEGVGVPRDTCTFRLGQPCVANPVMPGERVLKNENNAAGTEWFYGSEGVEHITFEQVWDPSFEVSASGGGQIRTFLSIDWVCDPFCGDEHRFANDVSNSPKWVQINRDALDAMEAKLGNITEETRFTSFSYAADNPGVLLEQEYDVFVTTSYWLAPPEGWSFVAGDDNPF